MVSESQIRQYRCEIEWIRRRLETPMSEAQRRTYLHQIKHKELTIMFEEYDRDRDV